MVAEWRYIAIRDMLSFFVEDNSVSLRMCLTEPTELTSFSLDWFDVLDMENRPVLTEREILKNLQAIVSDADELPTHEVCALVIYIHLDINAHLGCS